MYGNIEMIEFAGKTGIVWGEESFYYAARGGKVDSLKYLLKNGVKMGEMSVNGAVESGQFECLKFLIDNGCKPHPHTLISAVTQLRLDMVKLLREHGFEWYPQLLSNMVHGHNSSVHLLTYSVESGYTWDPTTKCAYSSQIPCPVCERAWIDLRRNFNLK
jgi:hypothetical protein